jgi:transcriptional regulator with XRE-family HTH domain
MVCAMAVRQSPAAIRRQLGAELRRLRERAQRTIADVADELRWSESKLSRIETAQIGIRPNDLGKLLTVYGVDRTVRTRFAAMAGQARQKAWWEAYGDALPDAYETYIGFEADAQRLREYNAMVVPGLLQTDEYAHAVIKSDSTSDEPGLVGQRVSVRLARRAVLTREPPLELDVIVDEAVLRRPVGGPDVLRRQLISLTEGSNRPTVTVRVVPFAAGAHRGLAGSFSILDFPGEAQDPIVYCDGMTGGVFRTRHHELLGYLDAFEALRNTALAPKESRAFIAALIGEAGSY